MIPIPEPISDQLYCLEWKFEDEDEDLFREGEVVGTFDIVREDETDEIIFIDFKVDGVLSVIRFKIEHVISIREYNYEKQSKL